MIQSIHSSNHPNIINTDNPYNISEIMNTRNELIQLYSDKTASKTTKLLVYTRYKQLIKSYTNNPKFWLLYDKNINDKNDPLGRFVDFFNPSLYNYKMNEDLLEYALNFFNLTFNLKSFEEKTSKYSQFYHALHVPVEDKLAYVKVLDEVFNIVRDMKVPEDKSDLPRPFGM